MIYYNTLKTKIEMSLVNTNWLFTNLNKKDLKILDCSWYLPKSW